MPETRPTNSLEDARSAAEITDITIERFRDRADVPDEAIHAALAALRDPRSSSQVQRDGSSARAPPA